MKVHTFGLRFLQYFIIERDQTILTFFYIMFNIARTNKRGCQKSILKHLKRVYWQMQFFFAQYKLLLKVQKVFSRKWLIMQTENKYQRVFILLYNRVPYMKIPASKYCIMGCGVLLCSSLRNSAILAQAVCRTDQTCHKDKRLDLQYNKEVYF